MREYCLERVAMFLQLFTLCTAGSLTCVSNAASLRTPIMPRIDLNASNNSMHFGSNCPRSIALGLMYLSLEVPPSS